jgi:hypothetical protein
MDLDENDDEVRRSWWCGPVAELHLVLPGEWPLLYPMAIHPEFRTWFRQTCHDLSLSICQRCSGSTWSSQSDELTSSRS